VRFEAFMAALLRVQV